MPLKTFLGIDVGSVTTKLAVIDSAGRLMSHVYRPTQGNPAAALKLALAELEGRLPAGAEIAGVAATGSARRLAADITGADIVKNEITSQAVAALFFKPSVKTVIEIGGQDSKIILIRAGLATDFAMNTICAAGTGSFLDQQASRLNLCFDEFSHLALISTQPASIDAGCTVFAESAMISKQQAGVSTEDIAWGLCRTLAGNYLSDVARGKEIRPPVVFQGGVAFNKGIVRALEEKLGGPVIIPPQPELTGAIGAALLVRDDVAANRIIDTHFRGFSVGQTPRTPQLMHLEFPAICLEDSG
ncbi:MAG: acyl-CoA dehydratase activase [Dehalococcoidales bacterium]